MITRALSEVRVVPGFEQAISTVTATTNGSEGSRSSILSSYTIFSASCGGLNGDSTANGIAGLIVDRLGLGRNYNDVAVAAFGAVDIGTSTVDAKFSAIYAWLYHSSTTCADDFDRYSTDREQPRAPAVVLNTTSTLASGFMATSTAIGTWGTFSATATGQARADYQASYDLRPAQRYLRPYLFVEAYASSSGGSQFPHVGVALVFGSPDVAPKNSTSTGQAWKN